jgi:serine/threonine protein kinase
VAIKTIKRDGLSSKLLDNLKSEIDILKSLSHRHITKLLDIVVRTPLHDSSPQSSTPQLTEH